ncbi:MAG: ribonuclease HIII [Bacilli bacterium]|nr:ribonuclease HIII [Bacilli bacterium]MDD4298298.1 ribonuclease HIII [Bacilli bacterium]MDD4644166.1 ribonuclease HIII [Bacilli bacterium]
MEKQKTIVYKISNNTMQEMINHFEDKKRLKTPPYAVFQADEADTVITLYESGKVVFQGVSADIDAAIWNEREAFLNNGKEAQNLTKEKKDTEKTSIDRTDYYFINSIGSDEVGTGDYFGPIIVASAYVNKKDISFLEDLGVKDSKRMTDDKIIKITPDIIRRIPHSIIILNNTDYNNNYSSDINMNKIKAILHNKALLTLLNKDKFNYDMIVVDQFVNKFKYYDYLKGNPQILQNITFTTKAEDKCLSVACASIISRYLFLKEMNKLSSELGLNLPKGAGPKVDEIGKEIVLKYGQDKLKDIAKLNFKNTNKILDN